MAHLTGFGLENFRVFKEYTWFDFAPITILVGPNNSGKSSLLKALLMLSDNTRKGLLPPHYIERLGESGFSHYVKGFSPELDEQYNSGEYIHESEYHESFDPSVLRFDSSSHNLGNPASTKSWNSHTDELVFSIPYLVNKQALIYQIVYQIDSEKNIAKSKHAIHILTKDKKTVLKITDHSVHFDINVYNTIFDIENIFLTKLENHEEYVSNTSRTTLTNWFLENDFGKESEILARKVLESLLLKINLNGSLECLPVYLLLKNLDFWVTNRSEQKRIHTENDQSNFAVLIKELHERSGKQILVNQFSAIVDLFGIKGKFGSQYEPEKGSYFPNINDKSLINFGFGYTQIFALIAKIILHGDKNYVQYTDGDWYMNSFSTLILEEPETNLHPKFQSILSEFLVTAKGNLNIQFLVETHSEYMIRKFQYLVAKGEMKPEDIVIYYFNDPNNIPPGQKQVKKINILEDGTLSDDFGPGFYDEADNLAIDLFNLQKSRRN